MISSSTQAEWPVLSYGWKYTDQVANSIAFACKECGKTFSLLHTCELKDAAHEHRDLEGHNILFIISTHN
jgi:hypothetical protein